MNSMLLIDKPPPDKVHRDGPIEVLLNATRTARVPVKWACVTCPSQRYPISFFFKLKF